MGGGDESVAEPARHNYAAGEIHEDKANELISILIYIDFALIALHCVLEIIWI